MNTKRLDFEMLNLYTEVVLDYIQDTGVTPDDLTLIFLRVAATFGSDIKDKEKCTRVLMALKSAYDVAKVG